MCFLHLTHSSAHTLGVTLRRPGSIWGFGALLKVLTSVVDNSCWSRDSNPKPRVTCPTLYPVGHDCPNVNCVGVARFKFFTVQFVSWFSDGFGTVRYVCGKTI